jgi:hypothetical protein
MRGRRLIFGFVIADSRVLRTSHARKPTRTRYLASSIQSPNERNVCIAEGGSWNDITCTCTYPCNPVERQQAFRRGEPGTKTLVLVLTLVTRSRNSNAFRRGAGGTPRLARVPVLKAAFPARPYMSARKPIPAFGAWIVGWRRYARPLPTSTSNTARTVLSTTVGANRTIWGAHIRRIGTAGRSACWSSDLWRKPRKTSFAVWRAM